MYIRSFGGYFKPFSEYIIFAEKKISENNFFEPLLKTGGRF